jgi:methionine-rich copper-binding protein CopC
MSASSNTSGRIRAVFPRDVRRTHLRPAAVLQLLLVTLVATLGTVLWAPVASAHDELLDLEPGNKVVVTTPPTQVQLVFGAAALPVGTQIRVTGPAGKVVSTGPVAISTDGSTVVEKLTTGLADGVYRVDWRVTSADGHPVSGTYTFTLQAAATTPSASATTDAPASTPPTSTPSVATTTGGSGGSTSSGSGANTGLVVGLAILAAAVAGAAFALVRRRNSASVSNEGNPKK